MDQEFGKGSVGWIISKPRGISWDEWGWEICFQGDFLTHLPSSCQEQLKAVSAGFLSRAVQLEPLCFTSLAVYSDFWQQHHKAPRWESGSCRALKCDGWTWRAAPPVRSVGPQSHAGLWFKGRGNRSHFLMGRLTKNVTPLLICYTSLNPDRKLTNTDLWLCSCCHLQSDFPHGINFIPQISANNSINP